MLPETRRVRRTASSLNSITIMMEIATCLHLISVSLAAFFIYSAASNNDCVYTIYVKTGTGFKAGTDSKIALTLGDGSGRSAWVPDLEQWGIMGPSHDYYERGHIDAFSGRGPCIGIPICRLNLTSDGSGHRHGWYCDYVEVTSTGPRRACSQTIFCVDRWLATDAPPYDLTAVLDGCGKMEGGGRRHEGGGAFVVRDARLSSAT